MISQGIFMVLYGFSFFCVYHRQQFIFCYTIRTDVFAMFFRFIAIFSNGYQPWSHISLKSNRSPAVGTSWTSSSQFSWPAHVVCLPWTSLPARRSQRSPGYSISYNFCHHPSWNHFTRPVLPSLSGIGLCLSVCPSVITLKMIIISALREAVP